jgi:hypothetical protein
LVLKDQFASFITTYNPNPQTDLLVVRGFTSTLQQQEAAGIWKPVTLNSLQRRVQDTPSSTQLFQDASQCNFLGFNINFFEEGMTIPVAP